MQKVPLIETLKNFLSLKSYIDSMFGTKLVVSLPLFTADPDVNNYVTNLRNALNEFVDWFEETNPPQPLHVRKIWGNPNDNFWKNGELIKEYYSNDWIHLTDTGRRTILANFRHHIHLMCKIPSKPMRRGASSTSFKSSR